MKTFIAKHAQDVIGVLSGFDRLVLRGTLRELAYREGMKSYLYRAGVLLKDFGAHSLKLTTWLKNALTGAVEKQGRPVVYLPSSSISKEDTARAIRQRDGITEGTIALLTSVEPCKSYEVYRNREAKKLELKPRLRKCLFLYHYQVHPVFGFMHARIQTWFPFSIQVCLNGREWLARQLDREGIGYRRRDNCLVWVETPEAAQHLFDQQLRVGWPKLLNAITTDLNPAHTPMLGQLVAPYYWSVYQSEWATDVMFRSAAALARIYPSLVHHGIESFSSPDVMRFLGQKVPTHGHVHRQFQGEVVSDLKHRPEGIRIKHRLGGNAIKLYDKQGNVLRFETTINRPHDFKVFRPKEGEDTGEYAWRPMRHGIADIHRRAKVSQAANDRYAQALAAVDASTSLGEPWAKLSQPVKLNGRRVRGLRPFGEDLTLLQTLLRGEFSLNGLRNRDLRSRLYPATDSHAERKRQSARISRQLRLLRAHGLLRKVPKTHRYQLSPLARQTIPALLAAHTASTQQLMKLAA